MSKVIILVEILVDNERVEEAKILLETLRVESIKEEGCVFYFALQDSNELNSFLLYEVFEDVEAQNYHKTTEHYKTTLKEQLEPLIIERSVRFLNSI